MRILVLATVFLLMNAGPLTAAESTQTLRSGRLLFGWATLSITPEKPVAIAGQYYTRISDQVNDPLFATALAIETRDDAGVVDQAVFVSCDLAVIRGNVQQKVRRRLRPRLPDLDVQKIAISATHTHTAPALTDAKESDWHPYDFMGSWAYRIPQERTDVMQPSDYLEFIVERIGDVVVEAWRARKPGGLSWALSHVVVAHNRRAVYADGTARMYGNTNDPEFSHIEGVSDHSLDVLFFWRDERKLQGIAITVYCPAQEVAGESYLSADFWYDTRKLLREKYDPDLQVLALTGASGDQSPRLLWNKAAEQAMRERRGLSNRQEIARRIVGAVDAVYETARDNIRSELDFQHRVKIVPLPVWKVSDQRYAQAQAVFEAGKDKTEELASRDYINWRVSRTLMARYAYQKKDPFYQAELHFVRLGDLAMMTNPFELYTDYGLRIKARSPATQTVVVQLTSDCVAYLPTDRAVPSGGYSARIVDGVVGPQGGKVLVDETVAVLNQMWPSPR